MSEPSVSSLLHEINYRDAIIAAQRKQIEQLMEWQRRRVVGGYKVASVELAPEALCELIDKHPKVATRCPTRDALALCRAAIKAHREVNGEKL